MEGLVLLADTDDNMCIVDDAEPAANAAGTVEPAAGTAGKDTVGQIEAPMRLAVLAMLAVVLVLLAGLVIQTGDTDILGIEDTADIPDIEDTVDILGIEDTECNAAYAVRLADIPDTEDIHEEYQE